MCALGCNVKCISYNESQKSSIVIALEETLKDPVLTGSLSILSHPTSRMAEENLAQSNRRQGLGDFAGWVMSLEGDLDATRPLLRGEQTFH